MRRLRNLVLGVSATVLLAAGAGLAIARLARQPSEQCHRYPGCVAVSASRPPGVVIDDEPALGLHKPTAIAMSHGHLWVTDAGGNSVTEFAGRAAGKPVVWSGQRYGFSRPGAITVGRNVIWVANSDSITEMRTTDGKVIKVVRGSAWIDKPRSLVLFGRKLWVANAASITEINAVTGTPVAKYRENRYGFNHPSAVAISHRRLWVANSGNDSVTEMDATTGAFIRVLSGRRFRFGDPISEIATPTRLWVASPGSNSLSEIDTTTAKPVRVIGQRSGIVGPAAMALAAGRIWVANAGNSSVAEIDTASGGLISLLAGARYGFASPAGLIADHGRIWVMNQASATVTELTPQKSRPDSRH